MGGQGLTWSDAPFFDLTLWPSQLDSNNPSVTNKLFTVSADFTAVPPGPYTGSVTLTVGSDNNPDFDITQPFEVTVRQGTAIPEPMTMGLLALGVAGLATRRKMAR